MLHLLPLTLSLPLPPLSCSLFEQLNWKMRDTLGIWESDVAVTKHNHMKKKELLCYFWWSTVLLLEFSSSSKAYIKQNCIGVIWVSRFESSREEGPSFHSMELTPRSKISQSWRNIVCWSWLLVQIGSLLLVNGAVFRVQMHVPSIG